MKRKEWRKKVLDSIDSPLPDIRQKILAFSKYIESLREEEER